MSRETDGSSPLVPASYVRNMVKEIYRVREYSACWYADEKGNLHNCGNRKDCNSHCPLSNLGYVSGLVPQGDGGVDKQPEVAPNRLGEGVETPGRIPRSAFKKRTRPIRLGLPDELHEGHGEATDGE